ncbi:unnamed protein product [Thlaspi arvense]|uniref:F-box domain-containing protein n=1 Tax=Thlaspi arvense TaxID=13288 RepID=A0AAU9ST23_THLAR|nr:unnamed protein product [Thlaspi arvense]
MRRSLPPCKKRKTENNAGDAVPLDLVTEVLNRLPARSVARFMLVSKSWARIIRSKCFIGRFPFGSLTQPLRLLMAFNHQDRKTGHQSCRFFYSSSLSSSSSIPTSFLSTITWPHQRYSRVEYPTYCVKGLVCVGETVCNPCSGKFITLPSFNPGISIRVERFFGYDPVNDEYKVLLMRKTFKGRSADPWSDFGVFTLGAKQESWRAIDCSVPHRPYSRGVCIDGAVYYIAHTGTEQKSVVRFDLRSEKFDIFARVSEVIGDSYGFVPMTLINYYGKVAIQPDRRDCTIHLFVFEAGKQNCCVSGANVIRYDPKGASCKTIKIEVDEKRKWFTAAMYFMDYEATLVVISLFPRGKARLGALLKNWDIKWSSEPDSHRKYEYEFVEVLSDYADGSGVSVAFLHKAKGFASVFFRMGAGDADASQIPPHSPYRFSHMIPSFKVTEVK